MKKLAILSILVGLAAFVGIILISAKSQSLSPLVKTVGFISLGYFGVICFTWGWLKIFKKK
ncbi:MAG TPA: hypothetical protein GYA05_04775 [Acholeplasmataceae bacterium]|jgi:arginine exporter protein ArgO|nr:hypothetical protein [Acholeplasmataceae bacterium]